MLNKIFIISHKNLYYKFIEEIYNNYKKLQPSSTFLLEKKKLNLNDNKIDVIITNENLNKNILEKIKKKKIIIFAIQKFKPKIKDYYDKQIDPLINKSNLILLENKYDILIKSSDYKNSDFFDIIKILNWDTKFWKQKTSFVSCLFLTEKIINRINYFNKKNKVKICTYLCDCHDRESVLLAEKHGFHFTDIRVTFDINIDKIKIKKTINSPYKFNIASKKDIPKLKKISKDIYMHSRYYFDNKYSISKISKFYMNWVEKAVKSKFDDLCLCLFFDNEVIAFTTIKIIDSKLSSIGLFGVDKSYMNKKVGTLMLQNTILYLKQQKIKNIEVITQGRNILAQKLYQKNGFKTKKTELWYHKWLN